MVPLDVTERFTWSAKELGALSETGRMGSLLAAAIDEIHARDGVFIPHDAVTALALTEPELFEWGSHWVRCEVSGEFTTGATVVDRRPDAPAGLIGVAQDVDVATATRRILEAIGNLEEPAP
jgi:inosine-uridine nucleoside N-ribohydrolase